jgi:tetratricopeptide (TPR) repeat protein
VAKRYTRKELRKEDEFVTFWQHAGGVIRQSARPILIGLGTSAFVIAALSLWTWQTQRRQTEASKTLSRAMRIYTTDLVADDAQAKKLADEDDTPRFKSVEDRRKATLSELDTVTSKYKRTGAALEASLMRAGVLFDAGQYDQAIQAYGDFLAKTDSDHRLRFLAREGRGYSFEAKGQYDQALDEFRKLESETETYKDRAEYHQARMLEQKKDYAGAQKIYKAVLEKHAATTLREDISNRLADLEGR